MKFETECKWCFVICFIGIFIGVGINSFWVTMASTGMACIMGGAYFGYGKARDDLRDGILEPTSAKEMASKCEPLKRKENK